MPENADFQAEPITYLRRTVVDNVRWFRDLSNAGLITYANAAKILYGNFVLTSGAPNRKAEFQIGSGITTHGLPITAYWCPFLAGGGLPGWVEFPQQNPDHRFMFTAAMQGCALVTTDSPTTAGNFRVYHNQHPGDQAIWQAIHAQGAPVRSIFAFSDYGGGAQIVTNAFNFMFYRNGMWQYAGQSNILNFDLSVQRNMAVGENGIVTAAV